VFNAVLATQIEFQQPASPAIIAAVGNQMETYLPKLFYIMGASGSGKDALINRCRLNLLDEHRCMVAHRYITRCAHAGGENHIELGYQEFQRRVNSGHFAMYWHANGLYYGIGGEIYSWLDSGFNVIVNGSRAYLPQALNDFGRTLMPLCLSVSPAVQRERLLARGRESAPEITQRISRAAEYKMVSPCLQLDNNGSLDDTVNKLLELIKSSNCELSV